MTMPSSGPISMSQLKNEFNGTMPINLSQYYRAPNGLVPDTPVNASVPKTGIIGLVCFYGTKFA